MGKKSREKKQRRLLEQSRTNLGGGLLRSVTFQIKQGKTELIDKFDRLGYRPGDENTIPPDLLGELRRNVLRPDHLRIFEVFINREETIDQEIDDKVLAEWLSGLTNSLMADVKATKAADEDPENEEVRYIQYPLGPPANVVLSLAIDRRIVNLWQPIQLDKFERKEKGVWVTKEYGEIVPGMENLQDALGFEYHFRTSGGRSTLTDLTGFAKQIEDTNVLEALKVFAVDKHQENVTADWSLIDHYLLFEVNVAPFDRLPSQTRATHYNRGCEDKNGRKVPPHTKRNPCRRLKSRDLLNDKIHVVYIARDTVGDVRYIGEGDPTRPNHVNSGVSHVYNLNKEHFSGRPMAIQLYADKLTKSEALTIERLLIQKYAGDSLWNTKDNRYSLP